jgi:hypothetical protein
MTSIFAPIANHPFIFGTEVQSSPTVACLRAQDGPPTQPFSQDSKSSWTLVPNTIAHSCVLCALAYEFEAP